MRIIIHLHIIAVSLLILAGCSEKKDKLYPVPGTWKIEALETLGHSHRAQIAVGSNGQINIIYTGVDMTAIHAKREADGITWQKEPTPFSVINLKFVLRLDNNDSPCLFYSCQSSTKVAHYADYDNGSWNITHVEDIGLNYSIADMEFDSSNRPHVLFQYGDAGAGDLRYGVLDNGAWALETVAADVRMGSLDLDASGVPHILYASGTDVIYTYWTGSIWSPELVLDNNYFAGSLELDSSGQPHFIYSDSPTNDLCYASKAGGVWNFEMIQQALTPLDSPGMSQIIIDSSGTVHIAYFNWTQISANVDACYGTRTAAGWEIETFATQAIDSAHGPVSLSMDVSDEGVPHFVYQFTTVGTPLYYATKY